MMLPPSVAGCSKQDGTRLDMSRNKEGHRVGDKHDSGHHSEWSHASLAHLEFSWKR